MRRGFSNVGGLVSGLFVCLLTLGVFWVLRDYGPESALRKFHRAAVNRNFRELSVLVTPQSYRSDLQKLAGMVDLYARNGARYQLGHVKRGNKRVEAEVVYIFTNRPLFRPHVLWIVEKVPGGWRVDVNETLERMNQI